MGKEGGGAHMAHGWQYASIIPQGVYSVKRCDMSSCYDENSIRVGHHRVRGEAAITIWLLFDAQQKLTGARAELWLSSFFKPSFSQTQAMPCVIFDFQTLGSLLYKHTERNSHVTTAVIGLEDDTETLKDLLQTVAKKIGSLPSGGSGQINSTQADTETSSGNHE